jgi:hypothetical protein
MGVFRLGKQNESGLGNSWMHFGPRFWDKPINEGCVEKGLALAKYVAFISVPLSIFRLAYKRNAVFGGEGVTSSNIWKNYWRTIPMPCCIAFSWGVSLCASANLRNKDDFINFYFANAVVGAIMHTWKDNITIGVMTFLVTSFVTSTYHLSRLGLFGWQGHANIQSTSAGLFHSGPLIWKGFKGTDAPLPTKKYQT